MQDNDLIRLFLPIIKNGLIEDGYPDVVVKQNNQPTQQGTPSTPTIFFSKIGDKRYGFVGRADNWDPDTKTMVHTETQYYETSFQISSIVRQSPLTPYQYTASDLVSEAAAILQSSDANTVLQAAGVGILRITEIRNFWYLDDRDQFEASPSFDFILSYQRTRITTSPVISLYQLQIDRV